LTVDHAVTGWLISGDQSDPFAWVASLTRRPEWHARAACRGAGTSAFFPTRGANAAVMARARAVCDRCTVTVECLDFAMSDIDAVGIWGGTTDRARRQLRRDATMAPTEAEAIAE
jgi:WhiB family redox-sensing transcriptional regulator